MPRHTRTQSHHQEPRLPERGGYALVFLGRNWRLAGDERWKLQMVTPTHREKLWGWRRIGGQIYVVWRASPRRFIAFHAAAVGMGEFLDSPFVLIEK